MPRSIKDLSGEHEDLSLISTPHINKQTNKQTKVWCCTFVIPELERQVEPQGASDENPGLWTTGRPESLIQNGETWEDGEMAG